MFAPLIAPSLSEMPPSAQAMRSVLSRHLESAARAHAGSAEVSSPLAVLSVVLMMQCSRMWMILVAMTGSSASTGCHRPLP